MCMCDPTTQSKRLDDDFFFDLASHLQMKHLGINQVCNRQSDVPHERIACSFGFD